MKATTSQTAATIRLANSALNQATGIIGWAERSQIDAPELTTLASQLNELLLDTDSTQMTETETNQLRRSTHSIRVETSALTSILYRRG